MHVWNMDRKKSLYTFWLATKIICDCHGFSIVGSENVKYVTSQEIIHSESDVKPRTMHIPS